MAKQQSFEAKTKKKVDQTEYRVVKVVYSYQSLKNGAWKFSEKLLKVPFEGNEEQFIKEKINELTAG